MNLFVSLQTVRQAGFASAWKSRSSDELKSFICGKIDEIITGSWCEGGGIVSFNVIPPFISFMVSRLKVSLADFFGIFVCCMALFLSHRITC